MAKKLVGNLTVGEVVQVFGRTQVRIGERIDEGDFDDGVQLSEVLSELQKTAVDLYGEYQDDDVPTNENP